MENITNRMVITAKSIFLHPINKTIRTCQTSQQELKRLSLTN